MEHYSDIAEEIARFYGYNNIPCTLMRGQTTSGGYTDAQKAERSIGVMARALGYSEIITYSFISPSYYDKIRLPADSPLRDSMKILNPLGEDTSIMRTTILPSMLEILTRNYNYRNKAVRLYEIGKVYFARPDGMADEPKLLCLGGYGGMDFFQLKGAVERILAGLRITDVTFEAEHDNPSYHPGRCAKVYAGGKLLGVLGDGLPHLAHQAVDVQLIGPRLRLAQGVGLAEQVQHLPLPGDLRGEAQAAEPLAAQEGGHVFLVNDALRRRQEGGVHDDREHLRVRGVGGGLGHVEDVGVFEDALAGGEGVVLVFHVVLHGAPGDDVELQLRMPVPVDAGPVKLVHDVQVKPDGVFRRPPELQGHQGVVRQDFRDLHSGLLCEKVPEYWEIIRCDFPKWML